MNFALPQIDQPIRLRFDRPMSDEELMRFCAQNETMRIERDANRELIVTSPTGMEGAGTELDVGAELRHWARHDGRGRAFGLNAGFTLADGSVRAADAVWVSWSQLNALTSEERKGFAPICPEFVIEVRSESDSFALLPAKMQMWLANGAELAWLLDPSRKTVEIYRPGREPDVLEGGRGRWAGGGVRAGVGENLGVV